MADVYTSTKTLWSETQFEILYLSLKRNRPEEEIALIVEDLNRRGHKPHRLVAKVRHKIGMAGAGRLAAIIKRARKGA